MKTLRFTSFVLSISLLSIVINGCQLIKNATVKQSTQTIASESPSEYTITTPISQHTGSTSTNQSGYGSIGPREEIYKGALTTVNHLHHYGHNPRMFFYDYRTTMEADKSRFTRKNRKVVVDITFAYERVNTIDKLPSTISESGKIEQNFTSRKVCKKIRVVIPKSCKEFNVVQNPVYKLAETGDYYYYEEKITDEFYDSLRTRNFKHLPSFEIEINDENIGGIKVNADVTYFDESGEIINKDYSHLQMDVVSLSMMEELDDLKNKVSRNLWDTLSNVLTTAIGALGTWAIMNLKRKLKISEENNSRNVQA